MKTVTLAALLLGAVTVAHGAIPASVTNITDRVTAERTARVEKGQALKDYENAVKYIEECKAKVDGDGAAREIEDLTNRLPRVKGMADIEAKAQKETPEERRDAAFCDAFCAVLVLTDDEARRWVAHLEKAGDDLEKSDKPLFVKTSSTEFTDELSLAIAKYGCGYTQFVFTYGTPRNLKRLRKAIEKRLDALY